MTTLREAAQQALEALETNNQAWKNLADSGDAGFWEAEEQPFYETSVKAITALRAALAEPVQEPVAWMTVRLNVPIQTTARKDVADEWVKWGEVQPLYTAPPHRKPLTEEAAWELVEQDHRMEEYGETALELIRKVERAHGIT